MHKKLDKMRQEVNQCEEKFLQAFRTGNVNVVEELLHDEMVYNNAVGDVVSKKAPDFDNASP
jgi:hypothetical protein